MTRTPNLAAERPGNSGRSDNGVADLTALELNVEGGKRWKESDYQGAAEYYRRATEEDGTVSTYFSNLAAAFLKLGRYQSAQIVAGKALHLEPRSFKARYRRAMARKGLNLIQAALVDIAGVLTANPSNSQARAELACLMEMQSKSGRRPLEPDSILAADFPHAYGSNSNPPLQNPADPHQMSLPFFYKSPADSKPQSVEINPGVVVSACMTCKVTKDKKNLKTCRKCRNVNYCNKTCQRADWPAHKYTCGVVDTGKMMKVGRNIHHHQFFQVHLILYALRAMGLPKLPSENHEFLLMRIAVTNILPVPVCLVPQEIVDIHRAVVAGTRAEVYLHSIWITTTSVYRPGEEERSRVGVLAVQPFVLQNVGNPMFTLDLYSHSYGLYRRVNLDLDFLFASINDELRLDTENHYLLQV
ncbi:hypothetical protein B0H14DRAFT_2812030 [Mycena olivaceomarginata]|nr:hypothetical protein B0H14DRAFT_2812030 [Mycena olivaceomarginata]